MPDMTVHCSVWTSSKMRSEHPEVYDLLVSTFEAAMGNSSSFQNFDTASQTPFIEYIDPETLGAALDEFHQVLVDYDSLLNPQKS